MNYLLKKMTKLQIAVSEVNTRQNPDFIKSNVRNRVLEIKDITEAYYEAIQALCEDIEQNGIESPWRHFEDDLGSFRENTYPYIKTEIEEELSEREAA